MTETPPVRRRLADLIVQVHRLHCTRRSVLVIEIMTDVAILAAILLAVFHQ